MLLMNAFLFFNAQLTFLQSKEEGGHLSVTQNSAKHCGAFVRKTHLTVNKQVKHTCPVWTISVTPTLNSGSQNISRLSAKRSYSRSYYLIIQLSWKYSTIISLKVQTGLRSVLLHLSSTITDEQMDLLQFAYHKVSKM